MFALLFAGLLLPIFSKMIKQKESIGQLTQLSFILVVVPAIVIAITCSFFSTEIMELLYHQHVEDSASIFAILMFGYISISITYIFGTLLTANGSLKQLNIMAFIGMLLNIVMNLILIPRLEAMGSAISSLTTQTLTAVIQVYIVFKIFKFRINYKLLFLLVLFAGGVILIGIISKDLPYNWMISMTIMVLFSVILAFGIRLIKIKNIYQIIKYDK
jgi:O-antigen/teichoic acid export membrane protein